MLEARLPVPAYDFLLKLSHVFNVMDARGAVGVTERQSCFATLRALSRQITGTRTYSLFLKPWTLPPTCQLNQLTLLAPESLRNSCALACACVVSVGGTLPQYRWALMDRPACHMHGVACCLGETCEGTTL
jgi:hypothetical protein